MVKKKLSRQLDSRRVLDVLAAWISDAERAIVRDCRGRDYKICGMFSVSGTLLVALGEYSQSLAPYWSHLGNILSLWHPIGRTWGIFSVSGTLLVALRAATHLSAAQ